MAEEGGHDDVVYNLQTKWKDLDKKLFVLSSSSLYFLEQLVAHPLEVIRTNLQVDQKKATFQSFKKVITQNGARGLYIGFAPATFGYLPGNAVYLLTYSYLKDKLQAIHNSRHPEHVAGKQVMWVSFASALVADVAAVSLYCPMEVVVQRLMVQDKVHKKYTSTLDAFKKIAAEEGLRGFYRGFGPVLLNSIPASAFWWTIYESWKAGISRLIDKYNAAQAKNSGAALPADGTLVVNQHRSAQVLGGAAAGAFVTLLTNPLDVIRTRLQTQHLGDHMTESLSGDTNTLPKIHYRNSWHAFQSIYKTEGVFAFTKGIGPRMAQWILFSSVSAVMYEFVVDVSTRKQN